jgi:RimJ/RimL family protein N-acetyltransferase
VISIERTTNMDRVKAIITHPKVYPYVTDDASPKAEDYQPVDHPLVVYALATDGDEVLGVWTLVPQNAICWEVHTSLLPCSYGQRSRDAAKIMLEWLWANTPCLRVITNVPRYNRVAYRFAKDAGLKEFGVNEKSFLKGGNLHDQIMLGISKEESEPCQS